MSQTTIGQAEKQPVIEAHHFGVAMMKLVRRRTSTDWLFQLALQHGKDLAA